LQAPIAEGTTLARRLCGVLAGIASIALFMSQGCGHWRRPEVVLIPNGYVGWVRISYAVKGEPALQVQRCAYEIVVPQNGRIATSSPMTSGLAHDEYYYVDEHGQRRSLKIAPAVDSRDGSIRAMRYFTIPKLENQQARQFRVFFVGTAADYQQARKNQDYLLSL
jgi:hypothetical protein